MAGCGAFPLPAMKTIATLLHQYAKGLLFYAKLPMDSPDEPLK
jgi:hypothetical protein